MKILCVSDQIDPLIYNGAIKQNYADIDIVLSAGDLPADYLDFIGNTLDKPIFFVFGNHHADSRANEAYYVDAKVRREADLIVAGLGGSRLGLEDFRRDSRGRKGDNQFTDFIMNMKILKMFPSLLFNRFFRGRFLDVLLTHACPLGIHDKKEKFFTGFKCFLLFMKIFKPKYLVHGHVHHYDSGEKRTTLFHDTLVINAYGHYIIDTEKNT